MPEPKCGFREDFTGNFPVLLFLDLLCKHQLYIFIRVADPFRHPLDGVISLANPIGSIFDKVKVGIFRFKCLAKSYDNILSSPETSIGNKLNEEGFGVEVPH